MKRTVTLYYDANDDLYVTSAHDGLLLKPGSIALYMVSDLKEPYQVVTLDLDSRADTYRPTPEFLKHMKDMEKAL